MLYIIFYKKQFLAFWENDISHHKYVFPPTQGQINFGILIAKLFYFGKLNRDWLQESTYSFWASDGILQCGKKDEVYFLWVKILFPAHYIFTANHGQPLMLYFAFNTSAGSPGLSKGCNSALVGRRQSRSPWGESVDTFSGCVVIIKPRSSTTG